MRQWVLRLVEEVGTEETQKTARELQLSAVVTASRNTLPSIVIVPSSSPVSAAVEVLASKPRMVTASENLVLLEELTAVAATSVAGPLLVLHVVARSVETQLIEGALPIRNSHFAECWPNIDAIVVPFALLDTLASLRPEALHLDAESVRPLPLKQHMVVRQVD